MTRHWMGIITLGALAATTATPVAAANQRAEILEVVAPAIVRIEALVQTKLNMGGQAQEQESRLDLNGALVDDRGLVMIWNSAISSNRMNEMMEEMGRGGDFEIEMRPMEFKVIVGEKEERIQAFLAATDTALDLAFLQLERMPTDAPRPLRFDHDVVPEVGDEVVAVSRMNKGFDFAPLLESARIGGEIRKPRRAWILDGELTGFGLPVFDLEGRTIGALTTVFSQAGEESPFQNMGFGMMGMMGGQGPFGAFVLPGSRVASLIGLARERADELREKGITTPAEPPPEEDGGEEEGS